MARVGDYSFGRIVVDGHEEQTDLILLPNRTVSHWWRRHGHELVIEDLAEVLPELPERLLIGTGMDGRMHADPDTLERLAARASRSRSFAHRRRFVAIASLIPTARPLPCT